MAIYHFSVKAISRGRGQSAVACAAYRSGEKLTCDYYGKEQDYTQKSGVEFKNIYAPKNIKPELLDRNQLWNAVERSERRKDALLAREFEIAFPQELNKEQRKSLLSDLCQDIVKKHGVVVDAAIHAPHVGSGSDERNYHAHIMFTTRAINKNGTFEAKKYRDFSRDNGTAMVTEWRKDFADLVNTQLEQIGCTERVSHLSYQDLGIEQEATTHEGYQVTQLRRMGIDTEVSLENNAIKARNAEKLKNGPLIEGLDQEIIASDAILSDLQQSKANIDAEYKHQQKIALERKREHLEAQAIEDAHRRAIDFHATFAPDSPEMVLITQYIQDHALLTKHGKQPQPHAPVEQPQPTWWQRLTGQQPEQVEQPPFFEINEIKAIAKVIVEREQRQAIHEKWERLEKFLRYSPESVDGIERDAMRRAYSGIEREGDSELAEFIKYYRQNEKQEAQKQSERQVEYERFMREEATKAREEAEAKQKYEKESEARLVAYRQNKETLVERSVNNWDDEPKTRPKNNFEP